MTGREKRHDILFESVKIGPKTLSNRFYAVPHSAGLGSEKPRSQAEFRGMKAEGGWAAVCTEYAPVSPDSDESPSISARLWDPDDARNLSLMCDRVHEHGALAGIELTHLGGYAWRHESRWPAIAPSQFPAEFDPLVTPKEMEKSDIARVREDWVVAASRARDVGFDIVYVYGGCDLPTQFLSPFYNHRSDEYGGSFRNRARFWLETLETVRGAVGEDCAIAVRFSLDAFLAGGVSVEEALEFVSLADHLVDLWDLNMESMTGAKDSGPSRFFTEGYQLADTGRIREATTKPIVGVARLTDPDTMATIVRSGTWDLIGGARPSIADPFLPAKIREGRYDDLRECIGCNICIMKAETGHHIGCTQNPTAGEEYRRGWHPERFQTAKNAARTALVVGAGPAGMECSMVLGKRGFSAVHLVEGSRRLGGHMDWCSQLPGLAEWRRLIDWRATQLEQSRNVAVVKGVRLDADAVRDYGGEIVVIATGSHWAGDGVTAFSHDPMPGADVDAPHVLTPEQLMIEGKRPPGPRVLVYDTEGYVVGSGIAERLANEGFAVQLVTPFDQVATVHDQTIEGMLVRERLHAAGVAFRRRLTLQSIHPGGVDAFEEFGEHVQLEADGVVLVTRRVSEDSLYKELAADPDALRSAGIVALYRVGDCVAPRLTADAIFDGHRLGREIDTPDPSVPLLHRRERELVFPNRPAEN